MSQERRKRQQQKTFECPGCGFRIVFAIEPTPGNTLVCGSCGRATIVPVSNEGTAAAGR
jgi:transcription elongation factor Elf1